MADGRGGADGCPTEVHESAWKLYFDGFFWLLLIFVEVYIYI